MPTRQNSRDNPVKSVVRSASLRRFSMLALEQTGFAAAVVFSGAILMLLAGTQILNWYWLALLTVTAVAVSVVRIRNRMVTRYHLAQMLDTRLQLNDTLSTAWFLLSEPNRRESLLAHSQIAQAEQIAVSLEPARAFPLKRYRTWELASVLGTLMCALFVARYFIQEKLSFEQSLIPIHLYSVLERLDRSLSAENQPLTLDVADEERSTGKPSQPEQSSQTRDTQHLRDQTPGQQRNPTESTELEAQKTAAQENATPQNGEFGKTETSEAGRQPNTGENPTPDARQQATTPTPNTKAQLPDGRQSSSSLLEKMKDAVSSLLAKMSPTAGSQKSAQKAQYPADRRSEEPSAGSSQQESQSPNAQKQQARTDPSSNGQQKQATETTQASPGRSSDSSADNKQSDGKSGIGRQDGQKELKEAEQLQAMGKLAEIIGKRSASLTGEVTVETSSGKQQLRTEYSGRIGSHADLGGEINRDEIPLMYRQYVREYMDRVHNQAKPNH